jgi:tripeptide aminopeptidase
MNRERLQGFVMELLKADGPFFHESEAALVLCGILDRLGVPFHVDDSAEATGSDTGNVIVGSGRARISFCAHMDTIRIYGRSEPVTEDGLVRGKNGGVIGADDRAGMAVLLEAMACMQENGGIPDDVHFLFTTCEEEGFRGAKAVGEQHIADAYNFVVDSGGVPVGYTVSRGASQYDFLCRVQGRMSHTGNPHGLNAALLCARLMGQVRSGRVSDKTFINMADVFCQSNPNTIPEHAGFKGQILSFDDDEACRLLDAMYEDIRAFFAENGCEGSFFFECACQGYQSDRRIIEYAKQAAQKAGLPFSLGSTGAGSDAHVFAQRGASAVKISCGMMNVHSNDECVHLDDMMQCVKYVLALADIPRIDGGF